MPNILLMEDDSLVALGFIEELESGGHTVECVIRASEAIESLNRDRFDLVITDVFVRLNGELVPDGGIKLIGQIRNDIMTKLTHTPRDIPIVAVSGGYSSETGADILKLSQQVGADATLRKPIKPGRLLEAVNDLLEIHQIHASAG